MDKIGPLLPELLKARQKGQFKEESAKVDNLKVDKITKEPIISVISDGRYMVGGQVNGILSTIGQARLSVGELVDVLWQRGRSVGILRHEIRKATFFTVQAGGGFVLEELFLYQTTAGFTEVYYRNDDIVQNLELHSLLNISDSVSPFVDIIDVGWGVNDNVFWVRQGTESTGKVIIHIFNISRQLNKAIGSGFTPSIVLVESIDLAVSDLVLCSIGFTFTRTGALKWVRSDDVLTTFEEFTTPHNATFSRTVDIKLNSNLLLGSSYSGRGSVSLVITNILVNSDDEVIISSILRFDQFDGYSNSLLTDFSFEFYRTHSGNTCPADYVIGAQSDVPDFFRVNLTEWHSFIINLSKRTVVYSTMISSPQVSLVERYDFVPLVVGTFPVSEQYGSIKLGQYSSSNNANCVASIDLISPDASPPILPGHTVSIGDGGLVSRTFTILKSLEYLPNSAGWNTATISALSIRNGPLSNGHTTYNGTLYANYTRFVNIVTIRALVISDDSEVLFITIRKVATNATQSGFTTDKSSAAAFISINGVVSVVQDYMDATTSGYVFDFFFLDSEPSVLAFNENMVIWRNPKTSKIFLTTIDPFNTVQVGTNLSKWRSGAKQLITLIDPNLLFATKETQRFFVDYGSVESIVLNDGDFGFPITDDNKADIAVLEDLPSSIIQSRIGPGAGSAWGLDYHIITDSRILNKFGIE